MSFAEEQKRLAHWLSHKTGELSEIQPAGNLTVEESAQVYRNSIFASRCNAMAEIFPVVSALLGEESFQASCSYFFENTTFNKGTYQEYSAKFVTFLRTFPPLETLVYLADVAELERRYENTLEAKEVVVSNATPQADIKVTLQNPLDIFSSPYPIYSIWAFH
ncbi:MAG: putative DNA-binding domain-containing protein, partial [Spirochaetota bacterium]